jgi:hypothetical protein
MTDFVEQGDFDAAAVAALARKHKDVVVGVKSAHYQKPGWESVSYRLVAHGRANSGAGEVTSGPELGSPPSTECDGVYKSIG